MIPLFPELTPPIVDYLWFPVTTIVNDFREIERLEQENSRMKQEGISEKIPIGKNKDDEEEEDEEDETHETGDSSTQEEEEVEMDIDNDGYE